MQKSKPTVTGLALVAEAQEKLLEINKEIGRLSLENMQLRGREQALKDQLLAAQQVIAVLKGEGNGENR